MSVSIWDWRRTGRFPSQLSPSSLRGMTTPYKKKRSTECLSSECFPDISGPDSTSSAHHSVLLTWHPCAVVPQQYARWRPSRARNLAWTARTTRWSIRVSMGQNFDRNVTRWAPHMAPKLISWCELTFDERFVLFYEKTFNLKLSGDEVYYTAWSLLVNFLIV